MRACSGRLLYHLTPKGATHAVQNTNFNSVSAGLAVIAFLTISYANPAKAHARQYFYAGVDIHRFV
jgi:hypothetical protein